MEKWKFRLEENFLFCCGGLFLFASAEKISTKEVKQNMGTQDKVFDAKVMGKQLKILRKKIGKNQEELAEYLNLSTETIIQKMTI